MKKLVLIALAAGAAAFPAGAIAQTGHAGAGVNVRHGGNVMVRHGGNVAFIKKTGHHNPWVEFEGNDEQWDRLIKEAEKRLPRRLMSQKEFARLKSQRPT